jgi:adenosine deaminase
VANHRIPLEVGLSSSVRTRAVESLGRHPLRRFLRAGLRVTLCTNNRLLLETDFTRELRLAADTFDLSLLEIENILLAGFKSAFLPQAERAERMRLAVAEFAEVRKRHGLEASD